MWLFKVINCWKHLTLDYQFSAGSQGNSLWCFKSKICILKNKWTGSLCCNRLRQVHCVVTEVVCRRKSFVSWHVVIDVLCRDRCESGRNWFSSLVLSVWTWEAVRLDFVFAWLLSRCLLPSALERQLGTQTWLSGEVWGVNVSECVWPPHRFQCLLVLLW